MGRFYVETSCGRDIVRDGLDDGSYLTPYEIVCLLNDKDRELASLRVELERLKEKMDLLASSND